MDHDEPRVPRDDILSLGLVPPFPCPTQNEMKVWTGEFLLDIRWTPIMFDPGIREAISSLGAHP